MDAFAAARVALAAALMPVAAALAVALARLSRFLCGFRCCFSRLLCRLCRLLSGFDASSALFHAFHGTADVFTVFAGFLLAPPFTTTFLVLICAAFST